MKLIRNFIDNLYRICNQKPFLARFKPVVNAVDSFFFGTDKTTTSAPHILDNIDIKRYMSAVIIALLPAAIAAIYFYGLRVLLIIAVSYIFGGLTEVIFAVVRKKRNRKRIFCYWTYISTYTTAYSSSVGSSSGDCLWCIFW